jgi:hypothetical protein
MEFTKLIRGRGHLASVTKKMIGFSTNMLDAIEKWRAKQRPIPNVSDAIRQLIEAGLKATMPRSK